MSNYCPRCGFETDDLSDEEVEDGEVCPQCLDEILSEELIMEQEWS